MPTPSDILNGKILIVDDLAANVLLLERMLRGAGYTSVASTRDPRTVYDLHLKNGYDLILLDLEMPGMDGFQVMEGLKELEKGGYLPVLVVTAQPAHKLRALQGGARDFLGKPLDLPEVLMRIRNMLEVRLLHKQAEEHRAFKASMVSVVIHEVGNTMLIMKLAAVILEENAPPDFRKKNHRYFDMILANVDRLSAAVKNLLNLGRLEAGKLAVDIKATDAAAILRAAAASMELLGEKKELQISLELPESSCPVLADEASLALAINNLLSNAIKYTPANGRIALGTLVESARPGYRRVYVTDTGIGVSVEDREKILGGNFRSESGKTMTPHGFGVGLSLAQQIVEAHDSTIEIEGAPGKGSRFSFLLRTPTSA